MKRVILALALAFTLAGSVAVPCLGCGWVYVGCGIYWGEPQKVYKNNCYRNPLYKYVPVQACPAQRRR
jgi:hypothetical protein